MEKLVLTGFARTQGKFTAEHQKKILLAFGVSEGRIVVYNEENGFDLQYALDMIRSPEVLHTVGGFRPLGPGRYTITGEIQKLYLPANVGKVIVDCQTGMRSDRDGALMLSAALAKAHYEKLAPNHADSVKRGRNGARKQWQEVRDNRMPEDEARAIWKDQKLRKKKKLQKMYGWTETTAYRILGETGRPPGRRT